MSQQFDNDPSDRSERRDQAGPYRSGRLPEQRAPHTTPPPAGQFDARRRGATSATGAADPTGEAQALLATLERLARNAMALLGAAAVSVSLLDRQSGRLTRWVAMEADADEPGPLHPNPYADIEQWVANHLTPALISDLRTEAQVVEQFPSLQMLTPRAYAAGAGVGGGTSGNLRNGYTGPREAAFRSLLCAPLMDGDHILGALTVVSQQPDAFDHPRQRLLAVFSEQAALAVSKTLQAEANATQARELSALLEASRALTSSLDPNQVFTYIVASIRKVISCDDAVIYVYDPGATHLRVVAGMGMRGDRLGGARIALDDPHSVAAWVAKNKRAQLTTAGAGDMGAVTETFVAGDDLSLLCVPLISKGDMRGVIMLARAQAFKPSELSAMLNLSNIVAATLENVELYQQAHAERAQQAAIFASASDGFAIADDQLTLSEVNEAFARMVGQPREHLLGQRLCAVFQRRSSGACRLCGGDGECLVGRALELGEATDHIECEFPVGLATGALGLSQPGYRSQPRPASQPSHPSHPSQPSQPGDEMAYPAPDRAATPPTGVSREPASYNVARRPPVASARIPRRYVDFSVTPIMGADEPQALLVGRDVTAKHEMDHMKSNFLSMVSHELRGPLQTINGYLDLSLDGAGGALPSQLAEFLRRARAGSELLTSLVDDLLLLSRRDAGQFTLFPQPTDLASIIRETLEEMEITAEDADVRLIADVPEELPAALVDGPRIIQVVRNLLTNAIKFTPTGGEVSLTATATDEQVLIRVRDTGIGIAQEHLSKIFDRFYQVGEGTTRGKGQGQGLGLAIVRIIVDGHGGTLNVTSEHRKGSEFTVGFPRVHD